MDLLRTDCDDHPLETPGGLTGALEVEPDGSQPGSSPSRTTDPETVPAKQEVTCAFCADTVGQTLYHRDEVHDGVILRGPVCPACLSRHCHRVMRNAPVIGTANRCVRCHQEVVGGLAVRGADPPWVLCYDCTHPHS